jgi:hypothetical protein
MILNQFHVTFTSEPDILFSLKFMLSKFAISLTSESAAPILYITQNIRSAGFHILQISPGSLQWIRPILVIIKVHSTEYITFPSLRGPPFVASP